MTEIVRPTAVELHPAEDTVRARRSPHVIAITSGKGGVGKTNLAVNLAWQLRQARRKVMILDADLGLANVDILFGLSPRHNISHVLAGEMTLEEILVRGPGGVSILPASSGVMECAEIGETQKIMLLQQMEELEPKFDYLLIDTGAGLTGNVVYFALAAQTILVVVTPEPTSMADAYALMKVLSTRYHQRDFMVLINEANNEADALEVFRRLTAVTDRFLNVAIDLAGYLPRDPKVREAVRAQRPFAEMFPNAPAAQGVKRVARQMLTLENDLAKSDLGLLWRNVLMRPAA